MLRDIPRIYNIFLMFGLLLISLITVYTKTFMMNNGTLQLNELLLTSAVQEVDGSSRMYEGVLLLNNDFEKEALERAEKYYSPGSIVQFEYIFDTDHESFSGVEDGPIESPLYNLGTDVPDVDYLEGRPLSSVRLKVKDVNDSSKLWTYQSTIGIDVNNKYEIIENPDGLKDRGVIDDKEL